MNLIKDFYDIESLFEILEKEFSTKFNFSDLLDMINNNLINPFFRYKGFVSICSTINDNNFLVHGCGYGEFYLSNREKSLDLVSTRYYEGNSLFQVHLEGFTFFEEVLSQRYLNKNIDFDQMLAFLKANKESQNFLIFITNYDLYFHIYSKYTHSEDEGDIVISDEKYSLKNDEVVSIDRYLRYDRNKPNLFCDIQTFGINDLLIPKSQIYNLKEYYLKNSENSKNKINTVKEEISNENEKLLLVIGALLGERKRAAGGKRIQSLVAQNIEDMTKNTDAMLSKSTLEKIFTSANKAFKPFNNNDIEK